MRCLTALMFMATICCGSLAQESVNSAIDDVLDAYHAAAGDWAAYFDLMTEDGVFIGTDASERWDKAEFESYASATDGWVYIPRERHINITPDGNSAWFDEILTSRSYGTSRGTGVLVRTATGWKIAQYALTFPIPNALVGEMTESIKAWEANQSAN